MKKVSIAILFVLLAGNAFAGMSSEAVSGEQTITKGWFGDWTDLDGDYDYDRNYRNRRGIQCVARSEYSNDGYRNDGWGFFNWGDYRDDYYYGRGRTVEDARRVALDKCSRDFSDCEVKCEHGNYRRGRNYRRDRGFFF